MPRRPGSWTQPGRLTPDQRLLRILLDDGQHAFEQALVARLIEHRKSAGSDPAPSTLLPLTALALAALAVQAHGWEWGVRSGYLPHGMLGSPSSAGHRARPHITDIVRVSRAGRS
ncbi:Imm49 family immunity protein [Streptomyces sp. NPDC096311]|uniref:Imm49 family immunity protein n=1 Tax=Streptomyces sp. NPDC096311 TaxID=3366083 RepID=UPI003829B3D8